MTGERAAGLVPYGGGNYGMPLELAGGLIVPNDHHFKRSNGPTPIIDPATWRLAVHGRVERPIELDLAALQALPRRTITAFLECAGNGRTRFDPPADGTPWVNDAAGNARWTGVSLREVLSLARPAADAIDVVAQGADLPDMRRSLPLATAMDPDVLLAWEMNGEPLPLEHGAPVRLFVPRWAGIASTKWVTSIEVTDRPWTGAYQGDLYMFFDEDNVPLFPIREMPVKSLITTPAEGAALQPGRQVIRGYAWSGFGQVTGVDVSTDGGQNWSPATITDAAGPLSWVEWEAAWEAAPGEHVVCARATDARGGTQPRVARWNARGYQMNAIQRVPVRVEGA